MFLYGKRMASGDLEYSYVNINAISEIQFRKYSEVEAVNIRLLNGEHFDFEIKHGRVREVMAEYEDANGRHVEIIVQENSKRKKNVEGN